LISCFDAHVWAFGGASVFRGQEFLRSTHVPVPDCDLAGAS